ncbi:MAG: hypothetical protein M4579_004652 [Chaenotheca gracillima]|nr:MAG: hypothetical protein M4579_004652 [Chaenotheca gracillima]
MAEDSISVEWSAQLSVTPSAQASKRLSGDKILLPPSALEGLLSAATTVTSDPVRSRNTTSTFDPFNPHSYAAEQQARAQTQYRQQQLPHPLTFRLVNPENGRVVHAGIREFSAEEGEVVISSFLRHALGLEIGAEQRTNGTESGAPNDDVSMVNGHDRSDESSERAPRLTVHAKQLPKGTFVRLRPLEAGYDPEDWKSLLEQHLRTNYTTLTNGEILTVPGGGGIASKGQEFRFLIDGFEPAGDGICVVDTDLEVDIEALNEEQARETLKRRVEKSQKFPVSSGGSSLGGDLPLSQVLKGQVQEDEYVDYTISDWDRSKTLEIELGGVADEEDVDIYVSPFSARQRATPRDDQFVFGDLSSSYPKIIRIQPSNVELENAEAIRVSVNGFKSSDASSTDRKSPRSYYISATALDTSDLQSSQHHDGVDATAPEPGEVRCKNCHQWVPERTMMLHENFCFRNNVVCPHCDNVFQKRSSEWSSHWHCPHDSAHGNSEASKTKHDLVSHTARSCPDCEYEASNITSLAHHRTTLCPGKLILCQFCHLIVPQEGDPFQPDPEALLSNLTAHELADGARTTECHLCNKIVRLRDMKTHLRHHDIERLSRPNPQICRNVNCGRTLHGKAAAAAPGNDLNLCGICYGPLYVTLYDPDGKALKRRVERRYLSQLLVGCGKEYCRNEFCKSGRAHHGGLEEVKATKDALPLVKPFVETLLANDKKSPLHFCVDEASQRRRLLAEMMAQEGRLDSVAAESNGKATADKDIGDGYELGWCVAALEATAGDLDRARGWLRDRAPTRAQASERR